MKIRVVRALSLASYLGLIAWTMYRVVMGGEQPGVVTADVNPGEMGNGALSEYYIGLSDYAGGQWEWHGPFTDNHVRISTGADVRAGGDYLSDLGNHFVCIVAFDGAVIDVVGVATNSYDETDTEVPPVPPMSATDVCDSDGVDIVLTETQFFDCPGVIVREWVATDDCGNTSTCVQIGRASCRERVYISVVAVSLKKVTQVDESRGTVGPKGTLLL